MRKSKGFFTAFDAVWMLGGVRTPMVDYCGAFGHISPTDLGIKVAREALQRAGVAPCRSWLMFGISFTAPGSRAARSRNARSRRRCGTR